MARDMTKGNITGHLIAYAVPLVFGNLFQQLYHTVDSVVVGQFYGKEALAAVGAAGPIMNAGKYVTDEQFFVLNGDTFYQMDFGDLSRIQQEKNLEMALVLRGVPDISRYGAARLTDGLLTAFNEKNGNTGAGTINGGVYLMKRALLDEIPEGKVSLENECIPRWMQEGRRLGGIVNGGYFIDIGVPEDYFRFQEDVRKGDITW